MNEQVSKVQITERDAWLPALRIGDEIANVLLYGQIVNGVLLFDDGRSMQAYGLVDNDSSSTQFGLRVFACLEGGWSVLSNVEAEWEPYSVFTFGQKRGVIA